MKFFNKKVLYFTTVILAVLMIFIGRFWYLHPTHYRYNDKFIIGSSVNEVIERYGDFDKVFYTDESENDIGWGGYIVVPAKVGFLGTSFPKYYMIEFRNGKAVRVSIEIGGWGG